MPPHISFRTLQFNVLADGLGLLQRDNPYNRKQYSFLSKVSDEHLSWEYRKLRVMVNISIQLIPHFLLNGSPAFHVNFSSTQGEITQYSPDIITMQEVDHYDDFFRPELKRLGYVGLFAPKPLSACLVVSNSSDGCAIFVKENKFRMISSESLTLALTRAKMDDEGDLNEEDIYIRAQNQVALIAVMEFIPNKKQKDARLQLKDPPLLIVSTTHLKSSRTATAERYRQKEITVVLDRMEQVKKALMSPNRPEPAILLSGSFNAVPESYGGYSPLTYRALKSHSLGLRSVYNEDLLNLPADSTISGGDIYTTWKIKAKPGGEEVETKRYSDYIFYAPFKKFEIAGIKRLAVPLAAVPQQALVASSLINSAGKSVPTLASMSLRYFLRTIVYLLSFVIVSAAIVESSLAPDEKLTVFFVAIVGIVFTEQSAMIFLDKKVEKGETNSNADKKSASSSVMPLSTWGQSIKKMIDMNVKQGGNVSWRRGGLNGRNIFVMDDIDKDNGPVDSKDVLYVTNAKPLLQPEGVLDIYSEEEIGTNGVPSAMYPSDHLAISANFKLSWETSDTPRAVDSDGNVFILEKENWVPMRLRNYGFNRERKRTI